MTCSGKISIEIKLKVRYISTQLAQLTTVTKPKLLLVYDFKTQKLHYNNLYAIFLSIY